MTTHFITAEIALPETSADLEQAITAELAAQGEPIRWAITQVVDQTAHVEAVVSQAEVPGSVS